jgi:hypothetical protein
MTNGGLERGGIYLSDLNIRLFAATEHTERPGTGRPVAERLANADFLNLLFLREGIVIDAAPSPYGTSRAKTLMNIDALETLKEGAKQQMLDSHAWIREQYFASRGGPPEQMTDEHMANLAVIGESLPAYLILRAREL